MTPLERIGIWLRPLAKGLGVVDDQVLVEKGQQIVEPVNQQVSESSDLYSLIWGAGVFADVHPILAYRLYLKSDVLGSVVHRIAHNIAGLHLGLTTDGQDFDDGDPVIDWLNAPSEGYSSRRFLYEIATSFLLTNEAWVVLRGRPEREPVARTWLYPFDVIDQRSEYDGLPSAFRTTAARDRRTYTRVERLGSIRYISEDGLNELVPIMGAEAVDRPYRGQSPVAPLLYSVQQSVEGKRHNTAVLKNGLKLTGAIQPPEGERFEDRAMKDITEAIQAMRGAATAGGTLVMPRRVEALDLAISNREMDYVQLLKEAKESVYTFYNIPLPLVSNDASTFNNFTTAQTALFDGAIFPVFDDLADGLRAGLLPRFPQLDNQQIVCNENTIRALKGRNLERMKRGREIQALTTNEIREMGGYDPVEEGDVVLVAATLGPLDGTTGMDFPNTTLPIPGPDEEPAPEDDQAAEPPPEEAAPSDGDNQ